MGSPSEQEDRTPGTQGDGSSARLMTPGRAVAVALAVVLAGALVWYLAWGRSADGGTAGTGEAGTASTSATGGATPPASAPATSADGESFETSFALPEQRASSGGAPEGQASVKTLPDGAALVTVTTPPPQTIAMLQLPDGFNAVRYSVTFRPYGTAPGEGLIVVRLSKVVVDKGDPAGLPDLTGKNALVTLAGRARQSVNAGGTYAGLMEVVREGDVGRLVLTRVGTE